MRKFENIDLLLSIGLLLSILINCKNLLKIDRKNHI